MKTVNFFSDYKIESISRCLFANGLDSTSRDMSIYYLRLSVANGTKIMLEKCRGQLIQQVKKLSCQIIESLQSDITSNVSQTSASQTSVLQTNVSQTSVSQTSVSQTEHTVPPGMTDTAAIQYTYAMTSACRSV